MKKGYIFWGFFIILLLIFSFFYNFEDNPKNREFNKPEKAFINSFFALRYKYESIKPDFDVSSIKNTKDKEKFDKSLKKKLLELLNMPFDEVPVDKLLNTYTTIDKGTYTENALTLHTSEYSLASAYLLIPKNLKEKNPAIIAMHQHGENYENGKEEVVGNKGEPDLAYGKELVERGYVVFAMDAPLFGERLNFGGGSGAVQEVNAAQDLFLFGHPPLGVIVQEDLVSLDYLYSLDFIDKDNIGCIGHSFGGVRCMYLAALDERIKVTVLSSSVANIKKELSSGATHTWFSILPGIARVTETSGILALISPRPLMIVHTDNDPIFPSDETQQNIDSVYGLYGLLEKRENFDYFFIKNEKHTFPKEAHNLVYEFMDKHLKKQLYT
ncbi:MAG: alpha/beta hydrolase family protein [Nanoarchaeota archaeon]